VRIPLPLTALTRSRPLPCDTPSARTRSRTSEPAAYPRREHQGMQQHHNLRPPSSAAVLRCISRSACRISPCARRTCADPLSASLKSARAPANPETRAVSGPRDSCTKCQVLTVRVLPRTSHALQRVHWRLRRERACPSPSGQCAIGTAGAESSCRGQSATKA
jgi:hypothetical protein